MGEFCTFRIKLISYMKYLLTIIVLVALSCNKDDDAADKKQFDDPRATSCKCQTAKINPNDTLNIYPFATLTDYSFEAVVPDTINTKKVTLRMAKNLYPVFDLSKPKNGINRWRFYFDKCPKAIDNAIYFFEFTMNDGRIIKGQPFQIWE